MKQGLVHLYTGEGKGKTTAAFGLALRAAGYDKKIFIMQFLKARFTGEMRIVEKLPLITLERANTSKKFIFQMNENEKLKLKEEIGQALAKLKKITRESDYEMVILDEIMGVISNQLLEIEQIVDLIKRKNPKQELILTGRDIPAELVELADYVTEMKLIKHPYQQNIPARKGIEF